uniref:Putative thioredoxin n=1 Tax=uncultured marine microorganism HF4000_ANIW137J11 TaxID=455532 RepID=B3T4Q4_9ZZZZ|nr:putative thioredoxin [uncultured marine microorganism HF4000_ANIW137J11]
MAGRERWQRDGGRAAGGSAVSAAGHRRAGRRGVRLLAFARRARHRTVAEGARSARAATRLAGHRARLAGHLRLTSAKAFNHPPSAALTAVPKAADRVNYMGNAIEVTDDTFESTIADNKLVLVDFWAPWCGPCRMVAPVLEEIADEHGDKVTIAKVNTDENQAVASKHGIMSIPTMMLFKDGEKIDQMVGALPKPQIMAKLEPHF